MLISYRQLFKGAIIMNRIQKLKMNSSMSVLTRVIMIISGLILPRLILTNYGSEANGLVNSIKQFLGIITFLDLGVGTVVKSALYRPLSKKDNKNLSAVLTAAKKYFQKIAYILVIYVAVLIVIYPLLTNSSYGYLTTGFLIFSMSISTFGQYYFGIINELLLSANQQDYIQLSSEIVVIILNLIISIFLINQGASLGIVKLGSGLIYLIRPVFLSYYVQKKFNVDFGIEGKEDPLPQRWNGLGQHIAYSILNGTDGVVITLFSTLENVSIYSVYNMIVSAIKMLVSSLTTGMQALFGDLYANDEISLLNKHFDKIEWIIHTGVIYLYGMTIALINSFVMLYTSGVDDVSYDTPLFSFLLVLAGAAYSVRSPYQSMVFSAGHFKQTQVSSYIEAVLNITLSLILINRFGLIGVAVGTLASMTYRTFYLAIYLSRNIVLRPLRIFVKHLIVDFLSLGTIMGIAMFIGNIHQIENIVDWIIVAVILGVVSLFLLFIINLIFYKDMMISTLNSALKKK